MIKSSRSSYILGGGAFLAMVAMPFIASVYAIYLLMAVLVLALLGMSVDFVTGILGLPTLGHAAFFGVGAYAGALTSIHLSTDGVLAILIAAGVAGLFAFPVGLVAARSRGAYFLMLTLCFAEMLHRGSEALSDVTGGSDGLSGVPAPTLVGGAIDVSDVAPRYWYVLGVVTLAFALIMTLKASPFGRVMRGIKENEARMRAIGYSTAHYKVIAFTVSGAFAGAAGAAQVAVTNFVSGSVLSVEMSILALIVVLIGGAGSIWGAFFGAAFVVGLRDYLSPMLGGHGVLLLGISFVLAIYIAPNGFAGGVRQALDKVRNRRGDNATASSLRPMVEATHD